jgi:hypothetical protein
MGNPRSLFVAALVAFLTQAAPESAAAQDRASIVATRIKQLASVSTGSISGTVLDERGAPLDGVVISALGGGTAFAVTDRAGLFTLRELPPGPYLLRAHLQGYLPARQTMVNVRPSARTTSTFTLRREGTATDPRVAAASLGGSETEEATPESSRRRDESETAWRLRHLRRPVLKDATQAAYLPPEEAGFGAESLFGRAVESSARLASALFSDLPVQGQVNLLTTGAFDNPSELLRLDRTTSVAFFSVGAPVGAHGDWRVRAALNQGDLSSWILSGNYVTRAPATHRYIIGMSYGLQRYEGGNALALAAVPEAARNVGSMSGYDEWTISRHLMVSFGAAYAHHDYLQGPGLFSPRVSVTITPSKATRLRAVATRQLSAPGGDEFLPPSRAEFVPPQRTFSPLSSDGFHTQGVQHYEFGVERDLMDGVTVGARAFRQRVDNQLVTVFGLRTPESPASDLGHYFVGSAGDVAVAGWGITFTHVVSEHVRGSVDYAQSSADWREAAPRGDRIVLAEWLPSAIRPRSERVHDLTTSIDTDVERTATRVMVLYKWSNAFLSAEDRPAFDARFDVQISQGLPFLNFLRAEWEALVAVRNVFRESLSEGSIYDELLIARPPKRLVGGLTVRF